MRMQTGITTIIVRSPISKRSLPAWIFRKKSVLILWRSIISLQMRKASSAPRRNCSVTSSPAALASQQGLHVAKGALLLQVPSASDSSLGSAGTMEQAWLRADSYEVTSREGNPGQASVKMFFSGFQANLSQIAGDDLLFAHCTVPLSMTRSWVYDTHFESGIGVGIHGHFPEGPVTVLKVAGDLSRFFVSEGELFRNQYEKNLCRTQVWVRISPEDAGYFLSNPIGNHHIIVPGHHGELFREFMVL